MPATKKRPAELTLFTQKASLLCSLILPMANEHIRYDTTEVVFPLTWADIDEVVHSYYSHLDIIPNFSPMDISSMPSSPLSLLNPWLNWSFPNL
ncbi:unnamed protein product [Rhizophagus irregularis]|nr:unnamed protein product [Rhizophagus irregularis]